MDKIPRLEGEALTTEQLMQLAEITPEDIIEAVESAPAFLAPFLYARVKDFTSND